MAQVGDGAPGDGELPRHGRGVYEPSLRRRYRWSVI